MQVVILRNTDEIAAYARDVILQGVRDDSITALGVATGSSPLPVYEALSAAWTPSLSRISAFALDEYVGLPYTHPESYHAVIDRTVTIPLRLHPENVHVPDGAAADLPRACLDYEAEIEGLGGIDLQLLGIGATGHIGFNEPTSSLASRTRIKTLTPQTRQDNARYFSSVDEVPVHCITQGLGTIMQARELLLIAQGASKAEAVAAAVEGPITSMCPGSVLQMHPQATVLLDVPAASRLTKSDYYHFVYQNRPTWQR